MRLDRMRVRGFGRLRELDVQFGERLTVVSGRNEAGKSTLHAAVLAALFGFHTVADRRREREASSLLERYRPWGDGPYGLTAEVTLSDGSPIVLDWRFGERTQLAAHDPRTGRDCTRVVRAGGEGLIDAARLWGVDRAFYARALCVAQGELGALGDADGALTRALEAAAAAGGGDASAQRAVALLERAIGEDIGSDRSPTRPLGRARAELERLERQLADADEARERLEDLARERASAGEAAVRAQRDAAAAAARRTGAELAALQRRIEKIDATVQARDQAQADADALPAASLDETALSEVAALRVRRDETMARLPTARGEAEGAAALAAIARGKLEGANERAAGLEGAADGPDAEATAALRDAEAALRAVDVAPPPPVELPAEPVELRTLEAEVAAAADRREALAKAARRARPSLVGAGALAAIAVVLALAGFPPAALLALVPAGALGGLAWHARRAAAGLAALDAVEARAGAARAAYDAHAAEARGRALERDRRAAEIEADVATARRRIAALVSEAGAAGAGDFRARAARRAALEQALRDGDQAQSALAAAEPAIVALAALEADLTQTERRMAAAYERLGAGHEDLAQAQARLERMRVDVERRDAAIGRRDAAASELAGLLATASRDDLGRQLAELEARGAMPAPGDLKVLAADADARAREAAEARERERELAGRLEAELERLPDPVELRERLAAARDRVDELVDRRDVLRLASQALASALESSYHDLAPALNAALSAGVDRITAGRYSEVMVDADFSVRLRAAEDGRLIEPERLSRGTLEQVYLLQRLEVARLLAGREPLPVLLDDPLAHCDAERREALATLLAELAETRQIVVFCTDAAAARALVDAAPGAVEIELSAPGVPVQFTLPV